MTELDKQKIRVLRLARKRISCGTSKYICHALYVASRRSRGLKDAAFRLREYIGDQLAKDACGVLDTWLEVYRPEFDGTAREARLQWIDWMIEQLEN